MKTPEQWADEAMATWDRSESYVEAMAAIADLFRQAKEEAVREDRKLPWVEKPLQ